MQGNDVLCNSRTKNLYTEDSNITDDGNEEEEEAAVCKQIPTCGKAH
jgi:hypothetical protein